MRNTSKTKILQHNFFAFLRSKLFSFVITSRQKIASIICTRFASLKLKSYYNKNTQKLSKYVKGISFNVLSFISSNIFLHSFHYYHRRKINSLVSLHPKSSKFPRVGTYNLYQSKIVETIRTLVLNVQS